MCFLTLHLSPPPKCNSLSEYPNSGFVRIEYFSLGPPSANIPCRLVVCFPAAPVSDRTSPFTELGPSFGQPQGTIFGPLQPAPKSQSHNRFMTPQHIVSSLPQSYFASNLFFTRPDSSFFPSVGTPFPTGVRWEGLAGVTEG